MEIDICKAFQTKQFLSNSNLLSFYTSINFIIFGKVTIEISSFDFFFG